MKYAPILIPTLCRYEHFVRCIESLKKNSWAGYTDVYVAVDYPPMDKYVGGHKKICNYLEQGDFSIFHSFHVVYREENCGSGLNMTKLRDEVLKSYDRFIRTDDDIEFSPNFLEFMDKGLEYSEQHPEVIAVSGYSYPLNWKVQAGCNAFLSDFVCPMWGTGFLADRYNTARDEIKSGYIEKLFKSGDWRKFKYTDCRLADMTNGALHTSGKTLTRSMSDIALSIVLPSMNFFVLTPLLSKARNHGFDGTGVYCQNVIGKENVRTAFSYPYTEQKIDQAENCSLMVDEKKDCAENRLLYNTFDRRDFRTMARTRAKIALYDMLGENYFALKRLFLK